MLIDRKAPLEPIRGVFSAIIDLSSQSRSTVEILVGFALVFVLVLALMLAVLLFASWTVSSITGKKNGWVEYELDEEE